MIDPLGGFHWSSLYERYDELASRYNPESPYLEALDPVPDSERTCYDCLVDRVAAEYRSTEGITVSTYEAIMYWKLYSQPAAIANICRPRRHDPDVRQRVGAALQRFPHLDPGKVTRDMDLIDDLTILAGDPDHWGMASQTALPARTTFLHLIFPDVVPIFDQMVMRAVGMTAESANQRIDVLRQYIPFAWQLADRYEDDMRQADLTTETTLRLIDMALWVTRGDRRDCR